MTRPENEKPIPLRAVALLTGAGLIAAERTRQIEKEGWHAAHDDEHEGMSLSRAAVSYAEFAIGRSVYGANTPPYHWPWEPRWWKPSPDPVRNLVKAGALIAAEIDRLQRLDMPGLREPTKGTGLNQQEPAPLPSDGPAVWDLVKADIDERDRLGTAKYGHRLTVGDGRRSLVDAYQEALDLVAYLRKAIAENPPPTEDPELRDTMLNYKRRLENLTTLCERRGLRVGWGDKGEVTLEEVR